MLVGSILNKHAHNFAEIFAAKNGTDFVGYADIPDNLNKIGQHFRPENIATTSMPLMELMNMTKPNVQLDDHHGKFDYPLTPVIATMTLLVGNVNIFLSILYALI